MAGPKLLGAYLRARRGLVTPDQVGLPVGARRTPGLRREEVATLAGISVDYYVRMEKGRDTNPSPQVLTALARVLQLDATATAYLHGLVAAPAAVRPPGGREAVPEGTRLLLDVLGVPAFVESRAFDVLPVNARATALSPAIRPGANRLRAMFLDDAERALHTAWVTEAAAMVGEFRASVGAGLQDPRVVALVEELSRGSEEFRGAVSTRSPSSPPPGRWTCWSTTPVSPTACR